MNEMTRLELLLFLEAIHTLIENGLQDKASELIEQMIEECKKK